MRRVVVLGVVLAVVAGAWHWSRLHRLRLADVRFAPIENVAAATGSAGAPVLNANKSHWLKACDQALGPMRVEVRATETPLAGVGKRRSDGAFENRAVHEGAVLGIARYVCLSLFSDEGFRFSRANKLYCVVVYGGLCLSNEIVRHRVCRNTAKRCLKMNVF